MLPLATVEEVRRLIDEGQLSQRKIAQKLGISRGTISAIASGKRGIYGREPDPEEPTLACLDVPPERCNGCGATVYKPCVLCRTREYQARQKRPRCAAGAAAAATTSRLNARWSLNVVLRVTLSAPELGRFNRAEGKR